MSAIKIFYSVIENGDVSYTPPGLHEICENGSFSIEANESGT